MNRLSTFVCMSAVAVAAYAASDVPAAPTNLTLTPEGVFDVALNWTLPTTYTDGAAFADGSKVSAVKVYRNSKEIALLDGAVTAFTDLEASDSNPNGHGYGLCVYEVSACVDNVWSSTCRPEQIMVGEPTMTTTLPWEPALKGLDADRFDHDWNYDAGWGPSANGLAFTSDGVCLSSGWLVGPAEAGLAFLPRRRYALEFKVEADANVLYSVGLTDIMAPDDGESMEFMQVIAGNRLAGKDATVQRVEFVYEPKHDGVAFWPESILFAVNVCAPAGSGELRLQLSYLKISAVEDTSVAHVQVAGTATDIEVYNLQGVLLGSAPSLDLPGYAPGLYAVRYRSGNNMHSMKVAVR